MSSRKLGANEFGSWLTRSCLCFCAFLCQKENSWPRLSCQCCGCRSRLATKRHKRHKKRQLGVNEFRKLGVNEFGSWLTRSCFCFLCLFVAKRNLPRLSCQCCECRSRLATKRHKRHKKRQLGVSEF